VLADDAFSFLVAWESCRSARGALVMAHHRVDDNARAGYIYLIMASAGTAALILTFGLLRSRRGYTFAQMRATHSEYAAAVLMLALLAPAPRRVWCRCMSGCRWRIRRREPRLPRS